jgi:hypothetical protein
VPYAIRGGGYEAQITSIPWNVCDRKVVLSPLPKRIFEGKVLLLKGPDFLIAWQLNHELCQLWVLFIPVSPRYLREITELHAVKAVFLGSQYSTVYNNSNRRRWCGEFYGYERIPRFIF